MPPARGPAGARRGGGRSFGWDLDLLSRILGWAGILERVGTTSVPDRYEPAREQLVGGILQLTPVGRWWLVS